ncbi:MAG: lipocalin family protein [Saprospiraceae bacterium]|nr:lipocalin family protein [Saprospiraceae bacterium]
MKLYSFFILAASLLIVSGCGNDSPEEEIAGTWKASKLVNAGCADTNENQNLTFSNGNYVDPALNLELSLSITLNADKTYSTSTSSSISNATENNVEKGIFTISGNTLTFCPSGAECNVREYMISGNTLVVRSSEQDSKCKTELTLVR